MRLKRRPRTARLAYRNGSPSLPRNSAASRCATRSAQPRYPEPSGAGSSRPSVKLSPTATKLRQRATRRFCQDRQFIPTGRVAAARRLRDVLIRMSSLFLRTLREDPADAEVPSHRLLVRAGYIRRAAPGGYTWLPLGKRVLDRVAKVVHDEMHAIGAQEVHFPALLPREPYEASGRWSAYGDDIFRLKDRRGVEYLLAPTHEELFTLLVKDMLGSYKDFPVILYQVQTKFRDEARPRAGLLRGREFLMKDSYSFDLSDGGLEESYRKRREAYIKIFDR